MYYKKTLENSFIWNHPFYIVVSCFLFGYIDVGNFNPWEKVRKGLTMMDEDVMRKIVVDKSKYWYSITSHLLYQIFGIINTIIYL